MLPMWSPTFDRRDKPKRVPAGCKLSGIGQRGNYRPELVSGIGGPEE